MKHQDITFRKLTTTKPLNQNRMKTDKGCACYGSNSLHTCFCKDYQPIKTKSKKSYRKKTKSEE